MWINGEKRTEFTPAAITTSLSDSGGAYNGGRGGMGGGMNRGDWGGGKR